MKITYKVTAQELINAGASVTQVRQGYRKVDNFVEETVAVQMANLPDSETATPVANTIDAVVRYKSGGSFLDNYYYVLPAKTADGKEVTASIANITAAVLVWGGSVQDSYVQVTITTA